MLRHHQRSCIPHHTIPCKCMMFGTVLCGTVRPQWFVIHASTAMRRQAAERDTGPLRGEREEASGCECVQPFRPLMRQA